MCNKARAGRRERGFTLVEVIVMMAVLTIGILGTLAVASVAVQSGVRNEQQAVAANLAREGVELVRSIRDSNWAAAADGAGPGCWDYYPRTQEAAGQPLPGSCNPRFQSLSTPTNFAAYLNVGNGMPYLVQQASAQTENSVYRLCQDNRGVFVPRLAPCTTSRTYFRRVTVSRAKDLGIDADDGTRKYSILVQSRVTWPDRGADDVIVEEYLTDWRKP